MDYNLYKINFHSIDYGQPSIIELIGIKNHECLEKECKYNDYIEKYKYVEPEDFQNVEKNLSKIKQDLQYSDFKKVVKLNDEKIMAVFAVILLKNNNNTMVKNILNFEKSKMEVGRLVPVLTEPSNNSFH